jgi:hypothetical protein
MRGMSRQQTTPQQQEPALGTVGQKVKMQKILSPYSGFFATV